MICALIWTAVVLTNVWRRVLPCTACCKITDWKREIQWRTDAIRLPCDGWQRSLWAILGGCLWRTRNYPFRTRLVNKQANIPHIHQPFMDRHLVVLSIAGDCHPKTRAYWYEIRVWRA